MRIGIVGCGLIGGKRARALRPTADQLIVVADTNAARARQLAGQFPGCAAEQDWRAVVERSDVDAVVVATVNDALAPVTHAAVRAGKHVLVEKPAARSGAELEPVAA